MKSFVGLSAALPKAFGSREGVAGPTPTLDAAATFDGIYRDLAPFVWRVLRGMGVADAMVEDALQDVFVVVHRRLADFDGRSVKSWLFQIAFHVAQDYRRKMKRVRAQDPLDDDLRASTLSPAEVAEQNEALRLLSELLDGMDAEKRAVLVLADMEGMSAPEIATMTGARLNTVYTRLRRARQELNAALARRGRP